MKREESLYEVLQLSENAEQEVIDAAFRRLARKYHPDVNKSTDATDRMKRINHAYEILSNSATRTKYDKELSQSHRAGRGKRWGTEAETREQAEAKARAERREADANRKRAEAEAWARHESERTTRAEQAEAHANRKRTEAEARAKEEAEARARAEARAEEEAEVRARAEQAEADANRKLAEAEVRTREEAKARKQAEQAEADANFRRAQAEARASEETEARRRHKRKLKMAIAIAMPTIALAALIITFSAAGTDMPDSSIGALGHAVVPVSLVGSPTAEVLSTVAVPSPSAKSSLVYTASPRAVAPNATDTPMPSLKPAKTPAVTPTATPMTTPTRTSTPSVGTTHLPLFDDFDGNALDGTRWGILPQSGAVSLALAASRLEMTIDRPLWSGGGISTPLSVGDFDASVDFGLLYWPKLNAAKIGLKITDLGSGWFAVAERVYYTPQGGDCYIADFNSSLTPCVTTGDAQGSLRISRRGSIVTTFYKTNGGWVQMGTKPGPTSPLRLDLIAWNDQGMSGTLKAYFDNASIVRP